MIPHFSAVLIISFCDLFDQRSHGNADHSSSPAWDAI